MQKRIKYALFLMSCFVFIFCLSSLVLAANPENVTVTVGTIKAVEYYSSSNESVIWESPATGIQCWDGGYSYGSDGYGFKGAILGKKIGSYLLYCFNRSHTTLLKTYIVDVVPYELFVSACSGEETSISFNSCSSSISISNPDGVVIGNPQVKSHNVQSGSVFYSYSEHTYSIKASTLGEHFLEFSDENGNVEAKCTLTVVDHSWDGGTITKPPTFDVEGTKTFICTNCGEQYTESIPVLDVECNATYCIGQSFTLTYNIKDNYLPELLFDKPNDCSATLVGTTYVGGTFPIRVDYNVVINRTGKYVLYYGTAGAATLEYYIEVIDHVASEDYTIDVEPSCISEGQKSYHCINCGSIIQDTIVTIPAKGHTEVILKGKEATCTEMGYTEGKKCSVCGEVLVEQEEIPAKGHTEVILKGKEATCTEMGYTEGKKCSVCGEILEEQKEVPALGHNFGEWKEVTAPSCTTKGTKERICGRCNEKEQESIPATGHTYVTDPAVEPTCTDSGLAEGSHCSVCGDVKTKQEVIPAIGHDWSDPTYNWTEDSGKVTAERICRRDAAHVETETVDTSYTEAKKASCTEAGSGVFTASFENKAFTIQTRESIIAATGHTEEVIPGKAATCKEAGLTEGKKCSVCGEILEEQKEIPATGQHTWDAGVVTKNPTTTAAGVKTFTCTVCGETKTESIAKLPPAAPAPDPILGNLTTLAVAAQALSENGDPAGAAFSILQLKAKKVKNTSITIGWKAVPGATGYVIYAAPCGTKYVKLAEVGGTSFTQSGLKKGTYYKYFVAAHNGHGNILASSKSIHVATSGGKKGNTKAVKLNKKKAPLKRGKTVKLKATLKNGKLKVSKHRKVAFESDNPAVATVSKSGKVKAVGKGTCYVYAYAQNGVFAKCKITVK